MGAVANVLLITDNWIYNGRPIFIAVGTP